VLIMTGPQDPQHPQDPNPNYPPPQGPPGQYGAPQYGAPQYGTPQYPAPGQQQYPTQQFYGQQPSGPQGQYPPGGYGAHASTGPRPSLWQRLGARADRRPVPRLGVTLTGVGVVLVIIGILVWSFTYIIEGIRDGLFSGGGLSASDSRRFLGLALALIVVAIGYALVVIARSGPLVTAGVAATALGIPLAMEFATFDLSGGDPFNTDAIVWVSVIAYLASYLFVRGARGHSFYLALTLLQLWGYAVGKAGPDTRAIGSSVVGGVSGGFGGTSSAVPSVDNATIAAVSLVFAVAYFAIAFVLDRSGRHGVALPFVVVGIPAMLLGIGMLAPDTKQIGTGIILLLVGLALCWYGARYARRFTAWFWGLAAAGGVVTIATKAATTGVSLGITMIVLGVVFAAGGWLAAKSLREPDDMAPVVGPAPVAPMPVGAPLG
jgi:hypothetical protein